MRSAKPFMAELAFALQAAGDDAELLKPLDRLMTWAESGAESQDDLVRRFDAVAEQVATRKPRPMRRPSVPRR